MALNFSGTTYYFLLSRSYQAGEDMKLTKNQSCQTEVKSISSVFLRGFPNCFLELSLKYEKHDRDIELAAEIYPLTRDPIFSVL